MFRPLPEYLFIAESDGALYDTRIKGWAWRPPLRHAYCYHYPVIHNNHQLKATLRAGQFAWPGGYQLFLLDAYCQPISFEGAKRKFFRRRGADRSFDFPIALFPNFHDDMLYCGITGERIPSVHAG